MFEKFTNEAKGVVVHAQNEARLLNHHYIGTEHLLLALANCEQNGAGVLASNGLTHDRIVERVEAVVGHGAFPPVGHLPFTPRAKDVLTRTLQQSLQLGQPRIFPEHILLGVISEAMAHPREGAAAQVFERHGVDLARLRTAVIQGIVNRVEVSVGPQGGPLSLSVSLDGGTRQLQDLRDRVGVLHPSFKLALADHLEAVAANLRNEAQTTRDTGTPA